MNAKRPAAIKRLEFKRSGVVKVMTEANIKGEMFREGGLSERNSKHTLFIRWNKIIWFAIVNIKRFRRVVGCLFTILYAKVEQGLLNFQNLKSCWNHNFFRGGFVTYEHFLCRHDRKWEWNENECYVINIPNQFFKTKQTNQFFSCYPINKLSISHFWRGVVFT